MDKHIRTAMHSYMLGIAEEVYDVAPYPVGGHAPEHAVFLAPNTAENPSILNTLFGSCPL